MKKAKFHISSTFSNAIYGEASIAPLIVFRVLFGFIMIVSLIRFVANGWIEQCYLIPTTFFPYPGFEWVQPFGETGMYLLYGIMGIAALGIMVGAFYRFSTTLFFLSFTYVELIDKTTYLNHYYFVSIIAFLLILVPANRKFSVDVWRNPALLADKVPAWTVNIFKLQLGMVYFFAGIAKLNPDWLLEAMPMRIWLPSNDHLPFIGELFKYTWVAFAFSWLGAIYDLTIPFFLLNRKTRPFAYVAVVGFHFMTFILFSIGMFPFIMVLSTLIFFSAEFHEKLLEKVNSIFKRESVTENKIYQPSPIWSRLLIGVIGIHFMIQLALPFRYLAYPGELFWTEEGFRFSWRVMLMEKAGYAIFTVTDPATGRTDEVTNTDFLTLQQVKMMSTQPDMILQFAHHIEEKYSQRGIQNPEVRAKVFVTLNGRGSRLYTNPDVDLTKEQESFKHKDWILPLTRDFDKFAANLK